MCGRCSSRSACASAKSDLRATLSAETSNEPLFTKLADSVALRSDCAVAQAVMELQCPHKADDKISSAVANGLIECLIPH